MLNKMINSKQVLGFIILLLLSIIQTWQIHHKKQEITMLIQETAKLQNSLESLEEYSFYINNVNKMKIHENGGISVGNDSSPTVNGLSVLGNIDLGGSLYKYDSLKLGSNNEIQLSVGTSTLIIDATGIHFTSDTISKNITNEISINSPLATINSVAVLNLYGGITRINGPGPAAARITDLATCLPQNTVFPILPPGASTVLINSLPAARTTDLVTCSPPVPIVSGSSTVLIANLPAARIGDLNGSGGTIVTGSTHVFIGG